MWQSCKCTQVAHKLKGRCQHVVCGWLCSKNCDAESPVPKQHAHYARAQTQSTPKVTPQDKSFTIPLTGRWGNQLTSRPGSVSCSLGVLNGRAPCLMGTGQPRRKLLWQGRGGVLLGATIEEKRSKDRRRWLMCFSVFVQYNCVSCRVGGLGNVYRRCRLI